MSKGIEHSRAHATIRPGLLRGLTGSCCTTIATNQASGNNLPVSRPVTLMTRPVLGARASTAPLPSSTNANAGWPGAGVSRPDLPRSSTWTFGSKVGTGRQKAAFPKRFVVIPRDGRATKTSPVGYRPLGKAGNGKSDLSSNGLVQYVCQIQQIEGLWLQLSNNERVWSTYTSEGQQTIHFKQVIVVRSGPDIHDKYGYSIERLVGVEKPAERTTTQEAVVRSKVAATTRSEGKGAEALANNEPVFNVHPETQHAWHYEIMMEELAAQKKRRKGDGKSDGDGERSVA